MADDAARKPTPAAKRKSGQTSVGEAPQEASAHTTAETPSPFDYTQVFSLASANVDAFVGATEAWLHGLKAINEELVRFADTRMQALNSTARSFAEADDTKALTDASLDYARNAAEEYFAETAKVVNLTADLARDSWVPLQEQWRSGLNGRIDGK